MAFAEQIKIIREEKGLTQKEFADLLLVSNRTVSRWERGSVSPTAEEITRIAEILNCTVSQLIGLSGGQSQDSVDHDLYFSSIKKDIVNEVRRGTEKLQENVDEKLTERNYYLRMFLYVALEFIAFKTTPFGIIPACVCVFLAFKNKRSVLLKAITVLMLLLTIYFAYCFVFGVPESHKIYTIT